MATAFASEPVRSLAAADTGELVEIRRILFGALRTLCSDLGVREGDVIRCRSCTASQLMLETRSGRVVSLDRDWARFIQIASAVHPELEPDRTLRAL